MTAARTSAYQQTGEVIAREYRLRIALTAIVAGFTFFAGYKIGAPVWWGVMAALLGIEAALYRRFLGKPGALNAARRWTLAAVSFACSAVYVWPAFAFLSTGEPQSYFAAAAFMAGTLIHLLAHNAANRLIFASGAAPMALAFLAAGLFAAAQSGDILPVPTVGVFLYAMVMAFRGKEAAARKIDAALADAERERAAALRASAAKSAFLAKMSHELRTPLNGVLGSAAALKDSVTSTEDRARLRAIETSGETLLALLSDALDVTRIEAGGLSLTPGPADLREVVTGALARWRPAAAAKGLTLNADISRLGEPLVVIDAARLGQALSHLLSNAVKFTDSGAILVKARASAGETAIEISDTGPGVAEAARARIFAPFEQADNSITRQHGGAGLGLALTAEIARAMGGAVALTKAQGAGKGGATFVLSFKAPPAPVPAVAAPAPAAPAPTQGPAILLVEDNEINRQVVRAFLRPLNALVVEAENGAEALTRLGERVFDLVLMDMHMPIMDGLTATRAIRAAGAAYAKTPIVALTAAVSDEDRAASFAAGVDDFLGKPVKAERLAATVRRFTQHRLALAG